MQTPTFPTSNAALQRSVSDIFYYLADYQVLVCRQHAIGLQNVEAHLCKHHSIGSAARHQLYRQLREYGWLPTLPPAAVALPPPLGPAFAALGQPRLGFACQLGGNYCCSFISLDRTNLHKHVNSIHQESWPKNLTKEGIFYNHVYVQTFFPNNACRYFTVQPPASPTALGEVEREESSEPSASQAYIARWEAHLQQQETAALVLSAEVGRTDSTGWFKRTGWLEHLGDTNLRYLADMAKVPSKEEV
jgi:hypothetical protein